MKNLILCNLFCNNWISPVFSKIISIFSIDCISIAISLCRSIMLLMVSDNFTIIGVIKILSSNLRNCIVQNTPPHPAIITNNNNQKLPPGKFQPILP